MSETKSVPASLPAGTFYIPGNPGHRVLYTGSTDNLTRRVFEHKNKLVEGFTKKYNVTKLIYYELCDYGISAFEREKEIKGWKRIKKILLIQSMNPTWKELPTE